MESTPTYLVIALAILATFSIFELVCLIGLALKIDKLEAADKKQMERWNKTTMHSIAVAGVVGRILTALGVPMQDGAAKPSPETPTTLQ